MFKIVCKEPPTPLNYESFIWNIYHLNWCLWRETRYFCEVKFPSKPPIQNSATCSGKEQYFTVANMNFFVGPGWPTIEWKHFPGLFRDSSEPIPGFFQDKNFQMLGFTKIKEIFIYNLTL